jgi:hypothetical protein
MLIDTERRGQSNRNAAQCKSQEQCEFHKSPVHKSSVIFSQSRSDAFIDVAVSAMKSKVEVVGWQKAKRMKSSLMIGQIVGHHVGGAQILERSVQHRGCAVLRGRAQREIAPTRSIRNLSQECTAGQRLLRCPDIDGVDQGPTGQRRI